ncbi:Uncharacterised protein [Mycobacteroides abscessus subsp. abscessus]|nr:Uncharacterised protein [Mycobacteroides abscessus subsp. abscessus]
MRSLSRKARSWLTEAIPRSLNNRCRYASSCSSSPKVRRMRSGSSALATLPTCARPSSACSCPPP